MTLNFPKLSFSEIKSFFIRYERYLSPVTLSVGFIIDNIMLQRIDVFFSNALIISYLCIAAFCTIVLNISQDRNDTPEKRERRKTFHLILVFILQFTFGALFGASFLFYSRSGSIIGGWPFLLLILAYIIGNEFFRKNYTRLSFQISAFFSALFAYLIFFIPVILGEMGESIFLISGVSSLLITGMLVNIMFWLSEKTVKKSIRTVTISILSIFFVVNFLYFSNLIPPLPLALKELGVYRNITRFSDGSYLLEGEKINRIRNLFGLTNIKVLPEQSLYVWSVIFAPTRLHTDIIHTWQYYDNNEERWVTVNKIQLSITGGRDDGFRTYSEKTVIFPGKWKVTVETMRGQLIGRIKFKVINSDGTEEIIRKTR